MNEERTPEEQYLDTCMKIIREGVWVENKRTGKKCKTIINADFEYDCSDNTLPLLTTKKTAYKSAIAEMLGYMRGYSNAADFRRLGTKTWDANANAESWQNSPYCKGQDDMGYCYGEVGKRFRLPAVLSNGLANVKFATYDQWDKVYRNLRLGIDDRREIVTFWHPGTDHMACLPACMHTHTFSILDGTLYLTSYQRSCDMPLGVPFNMVQVAWLLMVMAQITGLKPGTAFHKLVNVHIYEDQIDLLMDQLQRKPFDHPKLLIHPELKDWDLLMSDYVSVDTSFKVDGYTHHPVIKFPFSV